MFKSNWLIAIGLVVVVLSYSERGRAEERISAFVAADGKIVFTNMAHHSHPASRSTPSIGIRTAVPASATSSNPVSVLDPLIASISSRHGVDVTLVQSVIEVESNYNRRAVSPKGALGLMQLIPATGERFGVRDFFDPAQNIDGGVRYLRFLLEMFDGNLDLSLAAYNSGENRVARLGRIPAIPETQDYVRRVRSAYERRGGQAVMIQPAAFAGQTGASVEPLATVPGPTEVVETANRAISSQVDSRGVLRFSNVE